MSHKLTFSAESSVDDILYVYLLFQFSVSFLCCLYSAQSGLSSLWYKHLADQAIDWLSLLRNPGFQGNSRIFYFYVIFCYYVTPAPAQRISKLEPEFSPSDFPSTTMPSGVSMTGLAFLTNPQRVGRSLTWMFDASFYLNVTKDEEGKDVVNGTCGRLRYFNTGSELDFGQVGLYVVHAWVRCIDTAHMPS